MEIGDIIKYEHENTSLDFKSVQYSKEQFDNLLKDIIAMANAETTEDRYIIIGIKEKAGMKEFIGLNQSELKDSATYQQLVLANIEPDLHIDYFPCMFEGKLFGVLKISNCTDRPYVMKKNFKNLQQGDCFIRKGTQQSRILRNDLDRIYELKKEKYNYDKCVEIYFDNSKSSNTIELRAIKRFDLPSTRAEKKIRRIIEDKKKPIETKSKFSSLGSFVISNPLYGYEHMTIEELEEKLTKIKETYKEDDYYEFYEEHSNKFNIIILNNGQSYLEDCSLEIKIKKCTGLFIASKVYEKPEHDFSKRIRSQLYPIRNIFSYPTVKLEDDVWIISQHLGEIKHQIPIRAFYEDVRIVLKEELINNVLEIECRLFGRNLFKPLERILKFKVIDS